MVCNYCFSNEDIRDFIKSQGKQAEPNYRCNECRLINDKSIEQPKYLLSKYSLSEKLQQVIKNLYRHEYEHGLYGSATSNAEDDDMDTDGGCLSLEEVCWELFEDGDKLATLITQNRDWQRAIKAGDDYFSETNTSVWAPICWFEQESIDWKYFSDKIKHSLRFFDSDDFSRTEELEKLCMFFDILGVYEIDSDRVGFRARTIDSDKTLEEIRQNPGKELGMAPPNKAGHNRFSPSGISYIYLALDAQTAKKEVYKNQESCAVGRFTMQNSLKLLNLKKEAIEDLKAKHTNAFGNQFDSYIYCSAKALEYFINDIQKAVDDDAAILEYIPTQVLAEFINFQGYDGFIYSSSKNSNGCNIVLFKDDKISFLEFHVVEF